MYGCVRTTQNYKGQNRKEYKGKTNWTYWGNGEGFAPHFYHGSNVGWTCMPWRTI